MVKKTFIVLFIFINNLFPKFLSQDKGLNEIDSISYLIEKANDKSISVIERLSFAESAKRLAGKAKNDTLENQAYRYIALNHFKLKNYNLFKKASQEYLSHSLKIKDSTSIAKANVYIGEFYYEASESDSAYFYYYNAEKVYRSIRDTLELGKTLLKIAIVQKNEKDFIGSEVSTIEAISILEPLKSNDFLASLYNNLGIIYNELGDYDEAINYHKKALEIKKKFKNRNLESENNSINNIAVVYKDANNI